MVYFQYKRDNKPSEKKSDASETSETDRKASTAAADQLNIDTVNEMITFTGNCEFCNNPIKPFPTLHQQVRYFNMFRVLCCLCLVIHEV